MLCDCAWGAKRGVCACGWAHDRRAWGGPSVVGVRVGGHMVVWGGQVFTNPRQDSELKRA